LRQGVSSFFLRNNSLMPKPRATCRCFGLIETNNRAGAKRFVLSGRAIVSFCLVLRSYLSSIAGEREKKRRERRETWAAFTTPLSFLQQLLPLPASVLLSSFLPFLFQGSPIKFFYGREYPFSTRLLTTNPYTRTIVRKISSRDA